MRKWGFVFSLLCLMGFCVAGAMMASAEEPAAKTIEWCRLQHPQTVTAQAKNKSELVYGQLYIPGCSEGEKVCKGVKAELCIFPKGGDYTRSTCFPAKVNPMFSTDNNNDEYMTQAYSPVAGEFSMFYKFSLDEGRSWEYCDFDDEKGFDVSKTGTFIVTE